MGEYNGKKVKLYTAVKAAYGNKKAIQKLHNKGYVRDNALSNHNESVFFNPKNKTLLVSGAGTHNLSDVGTDAYLGVGLLKSTKRYKEAENVLKQAREKYKPEHTSISGHSLFGAIANGIASKQDKVTTLDAAFSPNQKVRENVRNVRTSGDIVSVFAPKKTTTTLTNPYGVTGFLPIDAYRAHDVGNIKREHVFV